MTWHTALLSEVADLSLGKMLDKAKNKGEASPYLANINVRWGNFDLEDLRTMRFEAHEVERYSLKAGDIVMCEGGEHGRCALWSDQNKKMMLQKALHRIRPKQQINSTYLYYYFLNTGKHNGFAPYFTGATIKHLPREQLSKIPIRFPCKTLQKKIGATLSSYDNLIATNQRRIALLEEAARLIYREWFVHMRFPEQNSTRTRDQATDDWNKIPLSEIADFVNGFAFKPEHQKPIGLPIVKIPELRDGISGKTPRNPGTDIPIKNHITTGDIIFSWSATLLVNEWADGPALLNQHLFKVIPKKLSHKRFIRFSIENAIPFLLENSVGTTMQHIRRSSLDKHTINLPNDKLINEFTSLVDPMIDLSLALQTANRQLATARDLLLPKLMSGQIDVSNIRLPDEDVVT